MNAVATTTGTWRTKVIGARGYVAVHPATTIPMFAKSFAKATNGLPTRRGVPPH